MGQHTLLRTHTHTHIYTCYTSYTTAVGYISNANSEQRQRQQQPHEMSISTHSALWPCEASILRTSYTIHIYWTSFLFFLWPMTNNNRFLHFSRCRSRSTVMTATANVLKISFLLFEYTYCIRWNFVLNLGEEVP